MQKQNRKQKQTSERADEEKKRNKRKTAKSEKLCENKMKITVCPTTLAVWQQTTQRIRKFSQTLWKNDAADGYAVCCCCFHIISLLLLVLFLICCCCDVCVCVCGVSELFSTTFHTDLWAIGVYALCLCPWGSFVRWIASTYDGIHFANTTKDCINLINWCIFLACVCILHGICKIVNKTHELGTPYNNEKKQRRCSVHMVPGHWMMSMGNENEAKNRTKGISDTVIVLCAADTRMKTDSYLGNRATVRCKPPQV